MTYSIRTRETFVDGWVRTGDEVIIKNGEVYVVDRLKVLIHTELDSISHLIMFSHTQEIMKVRGFQVAPAELEGHLLMHPDVVDACVVGIPDEYSGELPMAYIVLSDVARKRISGNQDVSLKLKAILAKVCFLLSIHSHTSIKKH